MVLALGEQLTHQKKPTWREAEKSAFICFPHKVLNYIQSFDRMNEKLIHETEPERIQAKAYGKMHLLKISSMHA